MTQPDMLMLLDDLSDTQRAIVLLLAKKNPRERNKG